MKQLSYISLAVAAAFAVGDAAAVGLTQNIWASGASAPTRAEYNAFASNCSAAGITIYMNGTSSTLTSASRPGDASTGNWFRYTCVIDAAKTATFKAWDGDTVNMYHTVEGGSFVAFQPHLPTPTAAARIDPALTGCVSLGTSGGVTVFKSCAKTTATNASRPDGGFADVEDDLWPTLNQGVNFAHKTANVSQLFGVAATEALYMAMQDKQKADLEMDATCVTGDFTPGKCQPNIGHDQYRAMISTTGAGGAYQSDWQPLAGAAGTGKTVRVCRRVESSGTQASSSAYFLENPCRQWVTAFGQQFPSSNSDDAAGLYDVVENSGTGDVKACLTNSNNVVSKTNASNGAAGNYASTAATNFAIGVMSAENIVASTDKFKYLKLDGVSPNVDAKQRAAGAKGKYGFVMELAYFAVPQVGEGSVSKPLTLNPSFDTSPFFDELANDMADPSVLDLAGVFVAPTAPISPVYDGDKVGSGAKFGNNCAPQTLFF